MSPDSSAFAYALEYRRYGSAFGPRADARVEFWIYDLAHRRGPRQIAGWRHEFDRSFRIAGWTADALFVESLSARGDTVWERLEPTTGVRSVAGAFRVADRPIRDQEELDAELRIPHVEEAYGEFALWDPIAFRLVPLFSLPVDSALAASGWDTSLRDREWKRLQDGLQDFASLDATSSARGLDVRIRTFAKRPLPAVRRYRLRLDFTVFFSDPDTAGPLPALLDTTIALDPLGATIRFHVPARSFLAAPAYQRARRPHEQFEGRLACTLRPDSLSATEVLVERYQGYANGRDVFVTVPIRD